MVKLLLPLISFIVLLIFQIGYTELSGEEIMNNNQVSIIFASFAETNEQINHIYYLAESIREFAGKMKDAPIRLYVGDYAGINLDSVKTKFQPLGVEIITSGASKEALEFYYAGKVFASGKAEQDVAGKTDILVWLDDDTIILEEPLALILKPGISFAYRPVMHNRSGSLYSQPPDSFWSRIYTDLRIADEKLFPMVTPADSQEIRAYFNAGLLAVRPERGILRKWGDDFKVLYQDTILANMCKQDITKRIFFHQTALVGAILNTLKREEMIELPSTYNYPLFFEQMFDANKEFGSIERIITLRYDIYFRNPYPQWASRLRGAEDKIAWLAKRLGK